MLICNEDFFPDNNISECRPNCETWNLYSGISETLTFVVIGLSTAVGLITTVVILILSLTKFRNMYVCMYVYTLQQNDP